MYSQKFKGDLISEEDTVCKTSIPTSTIVPSIRLPRRRDSRRDALRNRGRVVSGELRAYKALLEAGLPEPTAAKPLPPIPQVKQKQQDTDSILSELIDSYAHSHAKSQEDFRNHTDNTPTARYLAAVQIDPALLTGYTSV